MALDRQSIEKKDFPIGRRGYEPSSVDAHLANIAGDVEALQHAQVAPSAPAAPSTTDAASLASIASTRVQVIVEAAEATASTIERDARERATQAEQDADRESQRIRDEAIARSQEHLGKVQEATSLMLQRIDAMDSELSGLVDSLRTGANRVSADLYLVSTSMSELYGDAGRPAEGHSQHDAEPAARPQSVEALVPPPATRPEAAPTRDTVEVAAPAPPPPAAPARASAVAPPTPEPVPAPTAADEDVEGARLIALNMALNGQTRDETDRYLVENFELSDRAGLLDEVYATVEG